MSYDLHGSWDSFAGGSTTQVDNVPDCCAQKLPCCVSSTNFYGEGKNGYWGKDGYFDDKFSIENAVDMWTAGVGAAHKNKLVVGLATYGRTQKLTTDKTNLGDPTKGPGWEGAYTLEAGFLSYFEILGGFPKSTWHYNDEGKFLWASDCKQTYVSFEDECTLTYKTQWVKDQGFYGLMIWEYSSDQTANKEYPLLNAIRSTMLGNPMDQKSCERGTDFDKVAPKFCPNNSTGSDAGSSTPAPTPQSGADSGASSGGASSGSS